MSHTGHHAEGRGGRIRVAVADEEEVRVRHVAGHRGGRAAARMAAERWSITPPMATRLLQEFGQLSRADRQQVPTLLLTAREVEELRLTAEGLASREIAKRLYFSENTARNHQRNILQKRYWHLRRLA